MVSTKKQRGRARRGAAVATQVTPERALIAPIPGSRVAELLLARGFGPYHYDHAYDGSTVRRWIASGIYPSPQLQRAVREVLLEEVSRRVGALRAAG